MSDTTTDLSVEDRIGLYFRQPNALYRESPHDLLRLAMYELGNKDRRIESLQRENEALKASRDKLEGAYLSANERLADAKKQAEGQCDGCGEQLDDAFCTKCLNKRAAITPEMRERMGALLLAFDEGFLEMEEAALNGINIIRGLLGANGGMGDE